LKTETSPGHSYDATRIRYEPGNQSLAQAAATALGAGRPEPAEIQDTSSLPNVPLEIIVGKDYQTVADAVLPAPGADQGRNDTGRSRESN
ncbi:MAG: LytR C-terminal domain-containing protein, partial [Armatimonadota bacterium]